MSGGSASTTSIPTWCGDRSTTSRGNAVAVSRVFADGGDLRVGDTVAVRMADTARATLRVVAIYDRAAGLGDVLLDPAVVRRHTAVAADSALFVAGGDARRPIARAIRRRPSRRAVPHRAST